MVARDGWPSVYIIASGRNGTLYTGVTSELGRRILQHKLAETPGFTAKYGCKRLVWYERHDDMRAAIRREKNIKHWVRDWKLALIEDANPEWRDLSDGWYDVGEWEPPPSNATLSLRDDSLPDSSSSGGGADPRAQPQDVRGRAGGESGEAGSSGRRASRLPEDDGEIG